MTLKQITQLIETIPDFPQQGIQFKDISPLLSNAEAFASAINLLARRVKIKDFDEIIGIDARGFIFGSALAYKLKKGFIMARKEDKLPGELLSQSYSYEYSQAKLTLQKKRITPGKKYLIIDDVLATGSTISAVAQLIGQAGGVCVGAVVFIELPFLKGRKNILSQTKLQREDIIALIRNA
jgi:adenine phosphoribosyltransferase